MIPRGRRVVKGTPVPRRRVEAEGGGDLGEDLRARRHAGHVLGRLRVDALGDRRPALDADVEEVLVRDHPEAVGDDRVGHGVGDRGRGATLGDAPA